MVNRIADCAMIGHCERAALVSKAGSIDWLCMPRFESSAFFARLPGGRDNGHWSINAEDYARAAAAPYDPHGDEMLGDVPQAFSHVGLIIAALDLSNAAGPAQNRSQSDVAIAA